MNDIGVPRLDESQWARTRRRVRRHGQWVRSQGIRRLVEEDGLDPATRLKLAVQKARWRRSNTVEPRTALPVFLLGVQRSGTNMVMRGMQASPEFEVHNENDGRAFERFQLRPLPVVRSIVDASAHRFVAFKPLCDSHRALELLDDLGTLSPGKVVWVYRSVDGRVRSTLAKFGDHNARVLQEIAAGGGQGRWQAAGLSAESLELIRRVAADGMTPAIGVALFWYVRNRLLLDLGLHRRPDVLAMSYEALLADPQARMRALAVFLGVEWTPVLAEHIAARPSPIRAEIDLGETLRERCAHLQSDLDQAAAISSSPMA
jgi:hypothetical protein